MKYIHRINVLLAIVAVALCNSCANGNADKSNSKFEETQKLIQDIASMQLEQRESSFGVDNAGKWLYNKVRDTGFNYYGLKSASVKYAGETITMDYKFNLMVVDSDDVVHFYEFALNKVNGSYVIVATDAPKRLYSN